MGICAGSYYAGNFVDFSKDTSLSVQGARELSFFPGIVQEPTLAPYDYLSNSGARSADLTWDGEFGFKQGEKFSVFYTGGGSFVDAHMQEGTSILASYDLENKLPAIIGCD